MMVPSEGEMRCRSCGYSSEKSGEMKSVSRREEREVAFIEEDVNTLPTMAVECDDCGHDTAGWWLVQLRSADESETRFFRCLKCGNTWREYD